MKPHLINELNQSFERLSPEAIIRRAIELFSDKLCMASSLGAEDQVLTDMMCQLVPNPNIFVLDTGRLPQATYDVMATTMSKYAFRYQHVFSK